MTLSNKKELLTYGTTWKTLKNMLGWKKLDTQDYALYDAIYMKILENVKL